MACELNNKLDKKRNQLVEANHEIFKIGIFGINILELLLVCKKLRSLFVYCDNIPTYFKIGQLELTEPY